MESGFKPAESLKNVDTSSTASIEPQKYPKDAPLFDILHTRPKRDSKPAFYSHSILAALTTIPNLELIGSKIGQPDLAQRLYKSVQMLYKFLEDRRMALFMRSEAANEELDANIELYCQRKFRDLDSDLIYAVVTPEESDNASWNTTGASTIIKPCILFFSCFHSPKLLARTMGFPRSVWSGRRRLPSCRPLNSGP